MKRLFVVLPLIVAVLFGCSQSSDSTSPSDIESAQQLSASDVSASEATTVPANVEETATLLNGISDTDPVIDELITTFSADIKGLTAGSAIVKSLQSLSSDKALSQSLQDQFDAASAAIADFSSKKSFAVSISASNEDLGTYTKLASGSAELNAKATTSDGLAIAQDLSNLQSVSGDGTISLSLDSQGDLSSSTIKGFKIRFNAGGEASMTTSSLTFDHAESLCIALSVNSSGTGGIIILKAEAKNKGSISDLSSLMTEANDPTVYAPLVPEILITLAVYNDDGTEAFTPATYTSWADFVTAMGMNKS
jgi:hypothetical protein